MPPRKPRFAYDQDFPENIAPTFVKVFRPSLELLSLRDLDPKLGTLGDRDLMVRLHRKHRCPGLITDNYLMLNHLDVLAVIKQLNFHLIACEAVGDDALKASGLLLLHLDDIASEYAPDTSQVWVLRHKKVSPMDFDAHINRVQTRGGGGLVKDHFLSAAELDEIADRPITSD